MTREEAISWLTNEKWKNANNKYKKEWNEAFDMAIESLSADEVVRCKDCINWHSGEMGTGENYETYCEMLDTETDENAFCSDGERR